jgi:hypothetical protein
MTGIINEILCRALLMKIFMQIDIIFIPKGLLKIALDEIRGKKGDPKKQKS